MWAWCLGSCDEAGILPASPRLGAIVKIKPETAFRRQKIFEGKGRIRPGARPQAMTLIAILIATLAAGIGSVWLAAGLMRLGLPSRSDGGAGGVGPQHLLSLAAGALLATAFMHLMPEAFEIQVCAKELFATLLVGVVFFFLLDKAELWHHGH